MHSISISIAGTGRAWTTHVVRAGYGGGSAQKFLELSAARDALIKQVRLARIS